MKRSRNFRGSCILRRERDSRFLAAFSVGHVPSLIRVPLVNSGRASRRVTLYPGFYYFREITRRRNFRRKRPEQLFRRSTGLLRFRFHASRTLGESASRRELRVHSKLNRAKVCP